MWNMFSGAEKFNQPLNNWNVSNVTNMLQMFSGAEKFNQNISNWNVDKVTNFKSFSYGSWLTPENIPQKFRK